MSWKTNARSVCSSGWLPGLEANNEGTGLDLVEWMRENQREDGATFVTDARLGADRYEDVTDQDEEILRLYVAAAQKFLEPFRPRQNRSNEDDFFPNKPPRPCATFAAIRRSTTRC